MKPTQKNTPMNASTKLDKFWVSGKTSVTKTKYEAYFAWCQHFNITRTDTWYTAESSYEHFYRKNTESTLDKGGDWYRSLLLKINQTALNLILNSDVCYVNSYQGGDQEKIRVHQCEQSAARYNYIIHNHGLQTFCPATPFALAEAKFVWLQHKGPVTN